MPAVSPVNGAVGAVGGVGPPGVPADPHAEQQRHDQSDESHDQEQQTAVPAQVNKFKTSLIFFSCVYFFHGNYKPVGWGRKNTSTHARIKVKTLLTKRTEVRKAGARSRTPA